MCYQRSGSYIMSIGNFHMLWADTNIPQYSLSSVPNSITEGNSFTITLRTKRIPDGTTIGYTITGVNLEDLSTPGSLTGTLTVTSNTATLNVGTNVNDDVYVMILAERPDEYGEGGRFNVHRYIANGDLSSAAYLNTLVDLSFSPTNLGMYFKPDGSALFLQDPANEQFRRYNFSAAVPDPDQWNLIPSTPDQVGGIPGSIGSYGTLGTNHQGMWISSSGTTLFQVDRDLKRIIQDTIPVWNPLSCGAPERTLDISADAGLPSGISVKPDGTKAFISSLTSPAAILEYSGTAFECNTWSLANTFAVGVNPSDVFVTEDGTRMYVSDNTAKIHYCTLSTSWDLSTASLVSTWDLSSTFESIAAVYIAEPTSEQFRITLDQLDSAGNRTGSHFKEVTIYESGYP